MESPLLGRVGNQRRPQCNDPDSRRVTLKEVVGRPVWQAGAHLFPQNICSSGKFLLAGRCP